MPNITVTEARRRFGKVLSEAQHDPVFIYRSAATGRGGPLAEGAPTGTGEWSARHARPDIEKLLSAAIERHRDVFGALSKLD